MVGRLRQRTPHPPATPHAPAGGEAVHLPGRRDKQLLSAGILACTLVAMYGMAASGARQVTPPPLFGLTFTERREALHSFPSDPRTLGDLRNVLASCTSTMEWSAGELRVRSAPVQQAGDVRAGREAFRGYTVYGLPGDAGQIERHLPELGARPADVAACRFENKAWRAQGLCLAFDETQLSSKLERELQLLAQKMRQPALLKWWPYNWGDQDHHTMMQSVVPAATTVAALKAHHPVYIVATQDAAA